MPSRVGKCRLVRMSCRIGEVVLRIGWSGDEVAGTAEDRRPIKAGVLGFGAGEVCEECLSRVSIDSISLVRPFVHMMPYYCRAHNPGGSLGDGETGISKELTVIVIC
jgi:hypothetical protein